MAKKLSKSRKSYWTWAPTAVHHKPDEEEKAKVAGLFEPLVRELKGSLPPLENPQRRNQAVDIVCRWRGSFFYLMSIYKCPPTPEYYAEGFETGIARLEYKSPGIYDVAYFRHTGQWFTFLFDIPIKDCLEMIKTDPTFSV